MVTESLLVTFYNVDFFNAKTRSPTSQISHQYLKLVININCLQHPSPTSVTNVRHQHLSPTSMLLYYNVSHFYLHVCILLKKKFIKKVFNNSWSGQHNGYLWLILQWRRFLNKKKRLVVNFLSARHVRSTNCEFTLV